MILVKLALPNYNHVAFVEGINTEKRKADGKLKTIQTMKMFFHKNFDWLARFLVDRFVVALNVLLFVFSECHIFHVLINLLR